MWHILNFYLIRIKFHASFHIAHLPHIILHATLFTPAQENIRCTLYQPLAGHHPMLDQPLVLLTALRTLLADWDHSEPHRAVAP